MTGSGVDDLDSPKGGEGVEQGKVIWCISSKACTSGVSNCNALCNQG